jgi:hypothetical protein
MAAGANMASIKVPANILKIDAWRPVYDLTRSLCNKLNTLTTTADPSSHGIPGPTLMTPFHSVRINMPANSTAIAAHWNIFNFSLWTALDRRAVITGAVAMMTLEVADVSVTAPVLKVIM